MSELALLAVDDTLRAGGNRHALVGRLETALDIIERLLQATQKADNWSTSIAWQRRDVIGVLKQGLEHPDYFCLNHELLSGIAADYLNIKWMRHPAIDWIIVDALVTGQAIEFGERYKQKELAGPCEKALALLGQHHHKYYDSTQGNLWKMRAHSRKERLHDISNYIAACFLVSCVTYVAFDLGYPNVGIGLAVICAVVLAFWFVLLRKFRMEEWTKDKTGFERWSALWDVCLFLDAPVINPTSVKKAIKIAATKDVIIMQAAYAIIDDRWRINPAIWVARPRYRDPAGRRSLYDPDYERLRLLHEGGG
jgi:hypothetical protein